MFNEVKHSKSRSSGHTLKEELESIVKENPIVLFMKGNKLMPQCGFSAHVVGVLSQYTDSFVTVDVLGDPEIRQGMKEFSNWQTFPQLYVGGEFLGGCDIVTEMDEDKELEPKIQAVLKQA